MRNGKLSENSFPDPSVPGPVRRAVDRGATRATFCTEFCGCFEPVPRGRICQRVIRRTQRAFAVFKSGTARVY